MRDRPRSPERLSLVRYEASIHVRGEGGASGEEQEGRDQEEEDEEGKEPPLLLPAGEVEEVAQEGSHGLIRQREAA